MIKEEIFGLFANIQIGYLVDSEKVVSGDTRLDSSHFIDDVSYTVNTDLGFTNLSEFIQNVEEPTLFTRIYCDKEFGVPYISSSEMSEIEPPVDSRFISRTLTKNIEQYIIKRGQILVSAAGTVGSIVVATEELDGVAGTSDILRINLDQSKYLGFICTYLTSSYGANELSNLAYGAIIKRIRGFQLAELKTPLIQDSLINRMNQLILKVLENRDEANRLVIHSDSLILKYNNLPHLLDIIPETLAVDCVVETRMTGLDEFTQDYRLDAHFYNPLAKVIVENIKANCINYDNLYNISDCSFRGSRSTRNYVNKENGIAFLSGKNIVQIRPDFKYISTSETANISDMLLTEGQILISRSGTLGRTVLIHKNYEGFAASEHLIRVKPDSEIIDSGYLYAFLSSDYGYHQLLRYKHGSVIDEITEDQISQSVIPLPTKGQQKEIGDLVRKAYELRAEAIKLEDEAQELLTQALTKA